MKWQITTWLCLAVLATAAQTRPANSGLYAIWYRDKYELLDVPYIVGGQIVVQWHDVAPAADRYDFSSIGQELQKLRALPADKVSPLQLAAELERDMAEARRLAAAIRQRGKVSPTLAAEMADIDAWSAHGLYFAAKLRGGVALATFRRSGDKADQAAAVANLEKAVGHWRALMEAGTRFNRPRMSHNAGELFSWERFLPAVERDVAIARGPAKSR